MNQMRFLPIDATFVFQELCAVGGVSIPLMGRRLARKLALASLECAFTVQPSVFGPRNVSQNFSTARRIPHDSILAAVPQTLARHITNAFSAIRPSPWHCPLEFNRNNLQSYPASSCGIGRHRDFTSDMNVVAILNIEGERDLRIFRTTHDVDGIGLDTSPGRLILFRAMGFNGATKRDRPEHMVREVPHHSLAYVCRHSTDPTS